MPSVNNGPQSSSTGPAVPPSALGHRFLAGKLRLGDALSTAARFDLPTAESAGEAIRWAATTEIHCPDTATPATTEIRCEKSTHTTEISCYEKHGTTEIRCPGETHATTEIKCDDAAAHTTEISCRGHQGTTEIRCR
jgi:hypothetical protein